MNAVLPLAPFPPLHWWLLAHSGGVIDESTPFQKQTLRNRIRIAGPQGEQIITFGTAGSAKSRVMLSAHEAPIRSWRTLKSAYGNSPFFEHFEPELEALWFDHLPERPEQASTLNGWCWATIEWTAQICKWSIPSIAPDAPPFEDSATDLRDTKKLAGAGWSFHRYPQVFESKNEFIPGCSVLDALFLLGPSELSQRLPSLVHPQAS